ncbi:hypothetical protein BD770DRAFT_409638 [Pilaira anomala]|nr:hypothetical protein BD770DRAFT_409638 [Pilaira anomala]
MNFENVVRQISKGLIKVISLYQAKIAFDNSKGMFALLAMLKTVAVQYSYASVEEFRKLKLYFIVISDYGQCNTQTMVCITLSGRKKSWWEKISMIKVTTLLFYIIVFSTLKSCLEETMNIIAVLKSQHEEKERYHDSENNSQEVLLSDIICPRIFKLSYNTHGQHFANEHFKSSPKSDY